MTPSVIYWSIGSDSHIAGLHQASALSKTSLCELGEYANLPEFYMSFCKKKALHLVCGMVLN